MATATTISRLATHQFNSRISRHTAPHSSPERKLRTLTVRCAVFPEERRETRRLVSISVVLLHFLSIPKDATSSPFDKYVKRKKLEPLEAYVPAIILTEMQIEELGKTLEAEQPQYAACRSLLRAGPAASLRMNIRAVAQYANEVGNDKTASNDVDQCLRALEELDSLLLHASRNEPGASVKSMKSNIGIAVSALNSLLETVPTDILKKGKAIADAYNTPEEDFTPENLNPNLKQLESIL
ncbi:unnamed protein product [Lactuca saligna]|uniref:DUF7880 domain-containing protein n=1 Tax=Lactuca saligna TaxID=75948 RepID=A0AA36EEC4_LACSI|nr:unnamed protein product [Lactuca saligna]